MSYACAENKALLSWVIPMLCCLLAGSAAAENPASLVALWELDGDFTAANDSAFDGVLSGTVAFIPGKLGQAASFDAGCNRVESIARTPSSDYNGGFSIMAWINPNAAGLSKNILTHDNWGFTLATRPTGEILLFMRDTSDRRIYGDSSPGVVMPGSWTHVAVTWDGDRSGGIRCYRNGSEVPTSVALDPPGGFAGLNDTVPLSFRIGTFNNVAGNYDVRIDHLSVWKGVLTAEQINADFLATTTTTMTVAIDIKPGSNPNSVNPRNKGVVPVAILTDNTFDAATVDAATVRFGATGTEAAAVRSSLEDVDGDGDADRLFHFNTQATGIRCGDTAAALTGETFDGHMIQGTDSVKTAGCK